MAVTDVAVIGGGIVGVAAAAALAGAGARATLYEADALAAGASGRNSGVVQHPLDPELARLHRATLDMYAELRQAGVGRLALAPAPAGLLYVSRDPAVAEARAAEARRLQPQLRPEVIGPAELRQLEPSLAPGLTACRLEAGFPVAPSAATHAFAALARRCGVSIRLGAGAALVTDGRRVTGIRSGGAVEPCGAVIVAAGPWSPAVVDPTGRWRPITASWGVVVAIGLSRPPGHVLEQADIVVEPGQAPGRDVEFSLVTAAGISAVGSTFLHDEPEPQAWARPVLAAGARFVPEIGRAPVLGYRACARPLALDGRPLVGPVPWLDNAWIAAGHGPWGISTGPASGRRIAELALGAATEPVDAAFDPGRFTTAM